jgi:hypothetical protein
VKKSELIQVERTKKGIGRPKIILVEVVKKDISIKEVTYGLTLERIKWRKRTLISPRRIHSRLQKNWTKAWLLLLVL